MTREASFELSKHSYGSLIVGVANVCENSERMQHYLNEKLWIMLSTPQIKAKTIANIKVEEANGWVCYLNSWIVFKTIETVFNSCYGF